MRCSACGTENLKGKKYCAQCNERLGRVISLSILAPAMILIAVVAIFFLWSARQKPGEDMAVLFAAGENSFAEGNHIDAWVAYTDFCSKYPNSALTSIAKARIAEIKRKATVLNRPDKETAIPPDHAVSEDKLSELMTRAWLAYHKGRLSNPVNDNAMTYLREIWRIKPDYQQAFELRDQVAKRYREKADAAVQRQHYKKALGYYRSILAILPNDTLALDQMQNLISVAIAHEQTAARRQAKSPGVTKAVIPPPLPMVASLEPQEVVSRPLDTQLGDISSIPQSTVTVNLEKSVPLNSQKTPQNGSQSENAVSMVAEEPANREITQKSISPAENMPSEQDGSTPVQLSQIPLQTEKDAPVALDLAFDGVFDPAPPELAAALLCRLAGMRLEPAESEIVVHVMGDREVASALKALQGRSVGAVTLREVSSGTRLPEEAPSILYIADKTQVSHVASYCRANKVLSVSGQPEIFSYGTAIGIGVGEGGRPLIILNSKLATSEGWLWGDDFASIATVIR